MAAVAACVECGSPGCEVCSECLVCGGWGRPCDRVIPCDRWQAALDDAADGEVDDAKVRELEGS